MRIGRYLNQFVITRDLNVESINNTESSGVGVRVIAGGAYGFASTNDMTTDGVAGAARQAVAIAKANARLQTEPVRLAPVKGVGEVAWATPLKKDWRTIPVKEKADMLIAANKAGLDAGANFMTAIAVPDQPAKVFCLDRRLVHRPGHPPSVGADQCHRRRQEERQVPLARRPGRPGVDGL